LFYFIDADLKSGECCPYLGAIGACITLVQGYRSKTGVDLPAALVLVLCQPGLNAPGYNILPSILPLLVFFTFWFLMLKWLNTLRDLAYIVDIIDINGPQRPQP
jgi:hypothetical protein